jgi:hypothetical protein
MQTKPMDETQGARASRRSGERAVGCANMTISQEKRRNVHTRQAAGATGNDDDDSATQANAITTHHTPHTDAWTV